MRNDESSDSALSGWSRYSSHGQLCPASAKGVVSVAGIPAKSQSREHTRWQAVWPTVVQVGHRSGDGRVPGCSSVIAATTAGQPAECELANVVFQVTLDVPARLGE